MNSIVFFDWGRKVNREVENRKGSLTIEHSVRPQGYYPAAFNRRTDKYICNYGEYVRVFTKLFLNDLGAVVGKNKMKITFNRSELIEIINVGYGCRAEMSSIRGSELEYIFLSKTDFTSDFDYTAFDEGKLFKVSLNNEELDATVTIENPNLYYIYFIFEMQANPPFDPDHCGSGCGEFSFMVKQPPPGFITFE